MLRIATGLARGGVGAYRTVGQTRDTRPTGHRRSLFKRPGRARRFACSAIHGKELVVPTRVAGDGRRAQYAVRATWLTHSAVLVVSGERRG